MTDFVAFLGLVELAHTTEPKDLTSAEVTKLDKANLVVDGKKTKLLNGWLAEAKKFDWF